MVSKKILLVGGGGHCRSVADCLRTADPEAVLGIIERPGTVPQSVHGIPVVGCDDDLPRLLSEGWTDAVITLGSVGNPARRRSLFHHLKELGFHIPVVADSSAVIGRHTEIGEGTFLGKRTVVNAGTKIGVCAIINTGAVLEHDCTVGDFAHVSPGTVLCGEVTVGEGAHVGAGSVVRQQIQIGAGALIGIGSAVVSNIPANCIAYGTPCKVVEKL